MLPIRRGRGRFCRWKKKERALVRGAVGEARAPLERQRDREGTGIGRRRERERERDAHPKIRGIGQGKERILEQRRACWSLSSFGPRALLRQLARLQDGPQAPALSLILVTGGQKRRIGVPSHTLHNYNLI